jgi:dTDP-4-dehydrorhamnose 3,5-epimerase
VRVVPTSLSEVLIIEPDVHYDGRGFFLESYHQDKYWACGIADTFVQDNHSKSVRGTVRGLHLQVNRPQAKLVRVIEGEIYDVAVDLRRGSPTFGRWTGISLTAENFRQCYLPVGFAHGFAVLSATAQVEYKCTNIYDPDSEVGIAWNDPRLAIAWPVDQPIVSERDRRSPVLSEVIDRLPFYNRAG